MRTDLVVPLAVVRRISATLSVGRDCRKTWKGDRVRLCTPGRLLLLFDVNTPSSFTARRPACAAISSSLSLLCDAYLQRSQSAGIAVRHEKATVYVCVTGSLFAFVRREYAVFFTVRRPACAAISSSLSLLCDAYLQRSKSAGIAARHEKATVYVCVTGSSFCFCST